MAKAGKCVTSRAKAANTCGAMKVARWVEQWLKQGAALPFRFRYQYELEKSEIIKKYMQSCRVASARRKAYHFNALEDIEEYDWKLLDKLYFGGFLHNDKCKGMSQRGRPSDPEVAFRNKRIAAFTMLLELEFRSIEAAVADAMQVYGVMRSTVFAARTQWSPQLHKLGFDRISPAERRRKIQWFRDIEQSINSKI
jgi:hypothetical protein